MTENYKIISDIQELTNFVDTLEDNGRYIVQLAIRNKYADYPVSKNYNCLRKELVPKRLIIPFIKQLECPVGSYETHKGIPIKNNTGFVVYISANDINEDMGFRRTMSELCNMITFKQTMPRHPTEFILKNMFKSNNRKLLDIEFDFNDKNINIASDIKANVISQLGNSEAVRFIRTRGGIHCLINTSAISPDAKKFAVQNIKKMEFVDVSGSQMSHAVPGTFQGLHPVTMSKKL